MISINDVLLSMVVIRTMKIKIGIRIKMTMEMTMKKINAMNDDIKNDGYRDDIDDAMTRGNSLIGETVV